MDVHDLAIDRQCIGLSWTAIVYIYMGTCRRLGQCLHRKRLSHVELTILPINRKRLRPMLKMSDSISQAIVCIYSRLGPRSSRSKLPWLIYHSLCLSLFLSTLETTIVGTSIISIADALHNFDLSGWIVTSYLLTYTGWLALYWYLGRLVHLSISTGFLIIYAKFSDVLGRKPMLLLALLLFTVSSVACGFARTIIELWVDRFQLTLDMPIMLIHVVLSIIFRAFQGMGGSGIFSMVQVIASEMVPLHKIGKYMSIITSVFALSSVCGPLLGGVISSHGKWRWVFLLKWVMVFKRRYLCLL